MSYGLNIEMHKQVGKIVFTMFWYVCVERLLLEYLQGMCLGVVSTTLAFCTVDAAFIEQEKRYNTTAIAHERHLCMWAFML